MSAPIADDHLADIRRIANESGHKTALVTREELRQLLRRLDVAEAVCGGAVRVAYPEFCRDPKACNGKGSCPRDPNCAD